MSDDMRKAVLESVAYGNDATPGKRLRAIELLERLDPGASRFVSLVRELEGLSDEELDRKIGEADKLLHNLAVSDVFTCLARGDTDPPEHYPPDEWTHLRYQ